MALTPMDSSAPYDLLISAGRVLCAATGLDGPGAVAVRGGRIAAAGPEVSGPARERLDFPDGLLLPGLVDLHAHPARGGSRYGIDPDEHLLPRGVTTVLSQGDAGADNWPDYRDRVIGASRTRVRLAIHLSRRGESDPDYPYGSLADADVDACVAAIEDGGELIWGIAVNTGTSIGMDPHAVLDRALQAAGRSGPPAAVRHAHAARLAARRAAPVAPSRRRGHLLLQPAGRGPGAGTAACAPASGRRGAAGCCSTSATAWPRSASRSRRRP